METKLANYGLRIDIISLLMKFLKAGRTSSFNFHLTAMQEMLPYFAASRHANYLKSGHQYLSSMAELEKSSPATYASLESGYHSVRRSERLWAGVSVDLRIEQTLMKDAKGMGGMTHGRGMTETERALWVPINAGIQ